MLRRLSGIPSAATPRAFREKKFRSLPSLSLLRSAGTQTRSSPTGSPSSSPSGQSQRTYRYGFRAQLGDSSRAGSSPPGSPTVSPYRQHQMPLGTGFGEPPRLDSRMSAAMQVAMGGHADNERRDFDPDTGMLSDCSRAQTSSGESNGTWAVSKMAFHRAKSMSKSLSQTVGARACDRLRARLQRMGWCEVFCSCSSECNLWSAQCNLWSARLR